VLETNTESEVRAEQLRQAKATLVKVNATVEQYERAQEKVTVGFDVVSGRLGVCLS
jgi:predicted TIM-barrel enzyme